MREANRHEHHDLYDAILVGDAERARSPVRWRRSRRLATRVIDALLGARDLTGTLPASVTHAPGVHRSAPASTM